MDAHSGPRPRSAPTTPSRPTCVLCGDPCQAFRDLRDHSEERMAAKRHAGHPAPITAGTGKRPQKALPEPYLSVLNMSMTAFHCLSACFFQTTVYLPTSVVVFPCASFVFNSKVPTS